MKKLFFLTMLLPASNMRTVNLQSDFNKVPDENGNIFKTGIMYDLEEMKQADLGDCYI